LHLTRLRGLAGLCCLAAVACSQAAPDNRAQAEPIRSTKPQPAPLKTTGCSEAIQVVLDEHSFLDAGDKPFPAPRLHAFAGKAEAAFHRAADHACARVSAVRKALAPVRKLVVQSGAGAMDATFYRAEGDEPGALFFQWTFNEARLDVPKQADIEQGLRCWAAPDREECADVGD